MTNGLIAFFLAAGGSVWVYGKLNRSTGHNVKNSAIGAVVIGAMLFVIILFLFRLIPQS